MSAQPSETENSINCAPLCVWKVWFKNPSYLWLKNENYQDKGLSHFLSLRSIVSLQHKRYFYTNISVSSFVSVMEKTKPKQTPPTPPICSAKPYGMKFAP